MPGAFLAGLISEWSETRGCRQAECVPSLQRSISGCEAYGDEFENSRMSTTTPRAYSYIRFSNPEQASGDSYRRQAELSNRYAEEHGLNLDTSLSLCDLGISGFTGENRSKGALALFLKAVETGKVPAGSFLLVESLDRLSRDTMSEQMSLFIGLINAWLTVVTLADGQSYNKTTINNDLSKLMLSLVIMMRHMRKVGQIAPDKSCLGGEAEEGF